MKKQIISTLIICLLMTNAVFCRSYLERYNFYKSKKIDGYNYKPFNQKTRNFKKVIKNAKPKFWKETTNGISIPEDFKNEIVNMLKDLEKIFNEYYYHKNPGARYIVHESREYYKKLIEAASKNKHLSKFKPEFDQALEQMRSHFKKPTTTIKQYQLAIQEKDLYKKIEKLEKILDNAPNSFWETKTSTHGTETVTDEFKNAIIQVQLEIEETIKRYNEFSKKASNHLYLKKHRSNLKIYNTNNQ